jgi:hypothetical protein
VESTIRWTRLPRLASTLGVRLHLDARAGDAAPAHDASTPLPPPPDEDLDDTIVVARRNVARLMYVWPLGAGPCLRSSLVLGHLIRDRDPVLRLGVARVGHRLRAHAWIEVDGVPVNDPEGFLAFGAGVRRGVGSASARREVLDDRLPDPGEVFDTGSVTEHTYGAGGDEPRELR